MITTSTRRLLLLGLIALLVGVLVVLSGGLGSVHFRPGKPIPRGEFSYSPVEKQNQVAPSLTFINIFRTVLLTLLIGVGIVGVIGAIISPDFRRFLLRQLVTAGLIITALYLLSLLLPRFHLHPPTLPHRPVPPSIPVAAPGQPTHVTIPTVTPSHWWTALIALGAALLVVGIGIAGWWLFRRRRRHNTTRDLVLEQLGKQADIAVSRLRDGDDPRSVVLRCYREMCDILNEHGHVANPIYFTPREFARQLHARGMSTEYADRLTAIFEQVRYGHRYGPEFAREAVACLTGIKSAYASGR